MNSTILQVTDLTVAFNMYQRGFRKADLEVLHSLSLSVRAGEILAVVGSSGSGKSVLASAILGLLPGNAKVSGTVRKEGKIAYIPQSVDFLDPLMKVGKQVEGIQGDEARCRALFREYRLPEDTAEKYPFELSGGMIRRVFLSAARMDEPDFILADEPTPGLDLEMAVKALRDFRTLADAGAGILLITHDIDLALQVADRIAVFYAGTIVEVARTADFLENGGKKLRHPYSRAFLRALPQNEFEPIPGIQPYAGRLPTGCLFAPRCPLRDSRCAGDIPMQVLNGGEVRCVHAAEHGTSDLPL
ncbi:MAG: oligopeptide/dipeptide ABC transporter ATP-binding protein [Acutalibacteraceae bacterium]